MRPRIISRIVLLNLCLSASLYAAGWLSVQVPKQTANGPDTFRYSFYVPDTVPGKKYPLVAFYHSNGNGPYSLDRSGPIFPILTDTAVQRETPHYIFAPVCPQFDGKHDTSWRWIPVSWSGRTSYSVSLPPSIAMQWTIDEFKTLIAKYSIDTNRIHVTGGSMGGMASWDLVCRFPTMFASASPVSGMGDPSKAPLLTHLPVWAFVCTGDAIVSSQGTTNMVNALRTAGGIPILTAWDVSWHLFIELWERQRVYSTLEVVPWMLRQVKSTAVPTKVTGVQATATGYRVSLSWNAATDAVGDPRRIHYIVSRDGKALMSPVVTRKSGGQIYRPQWVPIRHDTLHFVDTDSTLQEGKTYSYTVQAYNDNNYFGPASDPAAVTIPPDNSPPAIRDIVHTGDSSKILIAFTERLDPLSAQVASNYSVSNGVAVSEAKLQSGSSSVLLSVSRLSLRTTYTITVNGVKDQTGRNTLSNGQTTYTFQYLRGMKFEFWAQNSAPTNLDNMVSGSPTTVGTSLSLVTRYPENGGARFTGVLQILEEGVYTIGGRTPNDCFRVVVNGQKCGEGLSIDRLFESEIRLTRGLHPITVLSWQQVTNPPRLWISWKKPGLNAERVALPDSLLFYNPDGSTDAVLDNSRKMLQAANAFSIAKTGMHVHIRYQVGSDPVTIVLYDTHGRLVRSLVEGQQSAGTHTISLGSGAASLPNGSYVARLRAGSSTQARMLIISR